MPHHLVEMVKYMAFLFPVVFGVGLLLPWPMGSEKISKSAYNHCKSTNFIEIIYSGHRKHFGRGLAAHRMKDGGSLIASKQKSSKRGGASLHAVQEV